MDAQDFGSCCKDLSDAMHEPPTSFLRIDDGVLYLSIGYVQTEQGAGFYDQAVLYCPFCGVHLQSREDVRDRAGG
jgi:hypothetical protein